MKFIVSNKLTHIEALKAMRGIEGYFRNNKRKKICKTELFTVRREHVVEDILEHTRELI